MGSWLVPVDKANCVSEKPAAGQLNDIVPSDNQFRGQGAVATLSASWVVYNASGEQMTQQEAYARWTAMCNVVADRMKVFTRPYVNILAGGDVGRYTDLGTGTFIKRDDIQLITCEHVARLNPSAYFLDDQGSSQLQPGPWRTDRATSKDVAIASLPEEEWRGISAKAQPLSMTKFAQHHAPVERELIFFRGIAGQNANYIGNFGVDAIISGYCSQEELETGDDQVFEILWNPEETAVTFGTSDDVRACVKYSNPAGFSGSLVWNTRFVELGCDLERWSPCDAVVTGLLRRFDEETNTLLVWRVEHLHAWLREIET